MQILAGAYLDKLWGPPQNRREGARVNKRFVLAMVLLSILLASLFTGLLQHDVKAGGGISITRTDFTMDVDTYVHMTNTTYNYGVTTFFYT